MILVTSTSTGEFTIESVPKNKKQKNQKGVIGYYQNRYGTSEIGSLILLKFFLKSNIPKVS